MWAFFAALITAAVSVYVVGVVAEDYRRFRDGQGIAAALAGELSGYMEGGVEILKLLAVMKAQVAAGAKLPFKEFTPPTDTVYLALADKLGMLGAALAKDTAYVYQRINGFRTGYMLLTREHASFNQEAVLASLTSCESVINAANARGVPLVKALEARASEVYIWPRFPKWRSSSETY